MPYGVLQTYRRIGRVRVIVRERPLAGVTALEFENTIYSRSRFETLHRLVENASTSNTS